MDPKPPSTPLVIRLIRPDEHEEVGLLIETAYTAGGLLDNDRGYGAHLRDVPGRADDHPVLVAERDGRIVGSVTITPYGSPQSELARDDELEFRYLAVATSAWGTGVARALVDAVEQHAATRGASWLVLCSIADNTRAGALYERLGFQRVPERDWHPAPGIDLLVSRRPVPAVRADVLEPRQEAGPVHDDACDPTGGDQDGIATLDAVLGGNLEPDEPPVDVADRGCRRDTRPDGRGGQVLHLDPRTDAGRALGQRAAQGSDGGGLEPGEQSRRGQDRHVAAAECQSRVVVPDDELPRP